MANKDFQDGEEAPTGCNMYRGCSITGANIGVTMLIQQQMDDLQVSG